MLKAKDACRIKEIKEMEMEMWVCGWVCPPACPLPWTGMWGWGHKARQKILWCHQHGGDDNEDGHDGDLDWYVGTWS